MLDMEVVTLVIPSAILVKASANCSKLDAFVFILSPPNLLNKVVSDATILLIASPNLTAEAFLPPTPSKPFFTSPRKGMTFFLM